MRASLRLYFVCVLVAIFTSIYTLAQSPEASSADYDVYSAFLKNQLNGHNGVNDLRVGDHAGVLSPVTITFNATSSPQRQAVKEQIKELQDSTFESFVQCQSDSMSLSHGFLIGVPYDIASRDDISSVEKFLSRYPENRCAIYFPCVGFNPRRTQAFFIVERSMCHSGVQKYVLMEKDGAGKWSTKNQSVGWIQ